MPGLPDVSQDWIADTSRYVAAMGEAITATEALASTIDATLGDLAALQAAIDGMHGKDLTIGVDAGAAQAAATATEGLAAAERDAAAAAAAAAAADRDLADAELSAALRGAALSAAAQAQAAASRDAAAAAAAQAAADRALAAAQAQSAASAADVTRMLYQQDTGVRAITTSNRAAWLSAGQLAAANRGLAASFGEGSTQAAIAASYMQMVTAATVRNAAATKDSVASWVTWADVSTLAVGRWLTLRGSLQLFGGELTRLGMTGFPAAIGGLHLMGEAIIEVAAVLGPAAVGLAVFAAAAIPAATDIYHQFMNMNTAARATGQVMPGLTNGFSSMAAAVQPQVYQLFGDAMLIANRNAGAFQKMAVATGSAVDALAARFTIAVTNGNSFSGLLSHSAADVAGLGTVIGNLGGILGNVLKVVPGYAEVLLSFAGAVTHVAETITSLATTNIPVLNTSLLGFGLAAHGAVFYLGLIGTAAAVVVPRALNLLTSGVMTAAAGLAKLNMFGAAAGMTGFAQAAQRAAALPWGWIAAAAVAVGFLAYKILSAKDATAQWIGSLQNLVNAASPLNDLAVLHSNIAKTTAFAANATAQLGQVAKNTYGGMVIYAGLAGAKNQTLANSINEANHATAAFSQQHVIAAGHIAFLTAAYGSNQEALQLLSLAGVKNNDLNSASYATWQKVRTEVAATAAAYAFMGNQAGLLGGYLNSLNVAGSDNVKTMQSVNQAIDAVIGIVAGGQNTFLAFETAINAIGDAAKKTGGSMYGLDAASITLRQDWQSAYTAGSSMLDALRIMTAAAPQAAGAQAALTRAMKDYVTQLITAGPLNAAQRAELIAMAQTINPAISNWKQLVATYGNAKAPAQDLNKIFAALGINMQNLSADASELATAMQSMSIATVSGAKLATSGFNAAATQWAADANKFGANSSKVQTDAQQMFLALVQSGVKVPAAVAEVLALTGVVISKGMQKAAADAAASGQGLTNAVKASIMNAARVAALSIPSVPNAISKGIAEGTPAAQAAASRMAAQIWAGTYNYDLPGKMKANGVSSVAGFATGAQSQTGKATSVFTGLHGSITGIFSGAGGWLLAAGRAIMGGLIAGVQSMIGALSGVLSGVTAMIPKVKGPLAKDLMLLHPAGAGIITGLINGMRSQTPALAAHLRDITALAAAAGPAAFLPPGALPAGGAGTVFPVPGGGAMLAPGGGGGGAGGGVTVHVHLDGQMDGQSVWQSMQTRTLVYGTRNTGNPTGIWRPT